MIRVRVVALAVLAFGTLLVADSRIVPERELLLRESETLLPPQARILSREYRERCFDFLMQSSPPCLSIRFLPNGHAGRVTSSILARAGARWRVARRQRHRDGWELRLFRTGPLRARASIRTQEARVRCRSPYLGPAGCADSLVVELGPPAVLPKVVLSPTLG